MKKLDLLSESPVDDVQISPRFQCAVIYSKGPTFYLQRTCEANVTGENSSFFFTVCVKPIPLYRFKLAYVFLSNCQRIFRNPLFKNGETDRFNQSLLIESF